MLQLGSNIWYYNKNIKNMIVGFLNLFPQMQVKTFNTNTGEPDVTTTVPILFGPIERAAYMNSEGQTVNRTVQLPLLQFELTGMEKDKTRTFAMKTLHMMGERSGVMKDVLMPVPYNFTITLNIFAKYQEDLLQLIEQIDPLFNFHRTYFTKHPIFPEDITLSHWVSISSPPNFSFNYEYSAEDRRNIFAVPIGFTIESWMVRESYESYGIIKEIITNYKDYISLAGLSKIRLLGDPTIRELIYTANPLFLPAIGQLVSGSFYHAVIQDVASGYSGTSGYYMSGANSGWSGYSDGKVIVKFNTEKEVFLKNEFIRIGANMLGVTTSCEPYEPFKDANTGWSGYSGYSGFSEFKIDGNSGVL